MAIQVLGSLSRRQSRPRVIDRTDYASYYFFNGLHHVIKMASLRPFFRYYGGKWRIAPKYPKPEHETIIEPFAGAAGYSVRHHTRQVILYDANPIIAGIWDYLIKATRADIERLPDRVENVDDVQACQEARWLIGFWMNTASTCPRKTPSKWFRQSGDGWHKARLRIAAQVEHIKHWRIFNKPYEAADNASATWFIDPPYNNKSGRYYKYHVMDFTALGEWCKQRQGQVIVCENEGADWLPFRPFIHAQSTHGKHGKDVSREAIYTQAA